jgi:tetratricopeptide (TPR) repeat protein
VIEPALQSPPEPVKVAKGAPKGPKALLAQAQRLLAKGDAEGALELFGRVAAQDPENAEALAGRGLCYLDLESYAPAEASFLAALRIDPGEADALLGLAETYRYQGKKMEAVSHYERYLAEHPDGEEAEVARNALSELRK